MVLFFCFILFSDFNMLFRERTCVVSFQFTKDWKNVFLKKRMGCPIFEQP